MSQDTQQETLTRDGASLTLFFNGPQWNGAPAATIGNVSIIDNAAGGALLAEALVRARKAGIDRVLGPMAGDTWHSYRFVTESDGSRPFLLEPDNSAGELAIFTAAGFAPVSHYFSAKLALADADLSPPPFTNAFHIETWNGENPEGLFREVFALSASAFAGNAFYTPISEDAFVAMYKPVIPVMKRELIFFARRPDGSLAGYLFAIPNFAEGPQTKTVILKTYASGERGAGRHLVQACHEAAHAMGFETVIHALIHDANVSAERSRTEGGRIFRRYALLGKKFET